MIDPTGVTTVNNSGGGVSSLVTLLCAIFGAIGILGGGWVAAYYSFKAKRLESQTSARLAQQVQHHDGAQKLIDQYQEGRSEDATRITTLEAKVETMEKGSTLAKFYIFALIKHIYDGSPPPPPPMPDGLF